MELSGKKAIVTGSTKGIGLAVARRLVESGVEVVISARSSEKVRATVDLLSASDKARVVGMACDVRQADQVAELIGFARRKMGGLHILVNNAGVGNFAPVREMTVENWRQVIGTNLDGVFYCCHFSLPLLLEAGEGFIINISSLAGKNAFPGGAAYNASKFALTGFSEALMQEVRHDNIRVAYIMPGSVDTAFAGHRGGGDASWKLAAEDVADVVIDTLRRHPRCLTSRIEMRPSKPPQKS